MADEISGWSSLCWIVTNFNGRTYVLCKLRKGLTTALMYLTCLRIYVKTEYKSPFTVVSLGLCIPGAIYWGDGGDLPPLCLKK